MKEGWKIKKLGEVCTINPPKKEALSRLTSDNMVSFLPMEDLDIKAYYTEPKQHRLFSDVQSSYTYFTNGDVLLAKVTPCFENGKIGIAHNLVNGIGFGSSEFLVFRLKGSILKEYLYYNLQNKTFIKEATKNLTGSSGLRRVPKTFIENYNIPVPPIAEQENIVAELDCLSGIIEKKKQQLKEYDALAQSIFYEMFGDPVDNEKGWEVNVIGNIANFYNGAAHEGEILENGKYHVVNSKFISSNGEVRKYCDLQIFPLYKNDIVMVMSDVPNGKALAKCYIIEDNDIYTLNQRICAFRNYELVPIFLYYCLNRNPYYLSFDNGNSQTNLRKKDVLNCPIIIPPLALQQEFASKIKAIEKQKALIKKSIEEVETLFNSRMNEYFN